MDKKYSIQELMDMHVHFSNSVMKMIDDKKRFIHDVDNSIVICEVKGFFGWKVSSTATYSDVFKEDFGRELNER